MKIKKVLKSILDAVFPVGITCNGCGKELTFDNGYSLCEKCMSELISLEEKKLTYEKIEVFSCYKYDKLARKYVLAYKDGNRPYLSQYMAKAMSELYSQSDINFDVVCFVPSCKQVLRRRGYDAMKNVAKFFAKQTNLPMLQKIARIKHKKDQAQLKFDERKEAVKGNFFVDNEAYAGKKVLILDDLVTSGATINECALCLINAGKAKKVVALTFARAI